MSKIILTQPLYLTSSNCSFRFHFAILEAGQRNGKTAAKFIPKLYTFNASVQSNNTKETTDFLNKYSSTHPKTPSHKALPNAFFFSFLLPNCFSKSSGLPPGVPHAIYLVNACDFSLEQSSRNMKLTHSPPSSRENTKAWCFASTFPIHLHGVGSEAGVQIYLHPPQVYWNHSLATFALTVEATRPHSMSARYPKSIYSRHCNTKNSDKLITVHTC